LAWRRGYTAVAPTSVNNGRLLITGFRLLRNLCCGTRELLSSGDPPGGSQRL